jgi:hypothetical protein
MRGGKKMAIDPSKTFGELTNTWNTCFSGKLLNEGQGFWHAGNTLDTYVNYLVAANKKDEELIVSLSQSLFYGAKGTPTNPIWWRDDYGWWGISFLNAADPKNAQTLGLSDDLVARCKGGADDCWQIMNADWVANGHHGVRNAPVGGEANTITNVLFLVLCLRRYESSGKTDTDALATAGAVFDWFYYAPPPTGHPDASGLLTKLGLIRVSPSAYNDDRAWTGDQGWFWRACIDLYRLDSNGDRQNRIKSLLKGLADAVIDNVFVDGIVQELPHFANYDLNYATGIGVFIRQFAIVTKSLGDNPTIQKYTALIKQSAQGAWDNSGWDVHYVPAKVGCWHPPPDPDHPCVYTAQYLLALGVWDLTIRTATQDAINAYMITVTP